MIEKNDGRSVVALVRCSSYEKQEVKQAVEKGIGLLGGVEQFAYSGERILLKPNILWPTDPARCIITHPSVVWATAKVFQKTGVHLSYGDSSAGFSKSEGAFKRCGYDQTLRSLGVRQKLFRQNEEIVYSEGISGKRLQIAEEVLAADGVVNIAKLKSHGLTRLTGAVKNTFGCVVGMTKGDYHARFPDAYDFSRLLVDIAKRVRPRLHIMDAVEAMEGNGPQSGTPKKLGILLFSTDPIALDAVACRLIHLKSEYVPTIIAGVEAGLGIGDEENITLVGDEITDFIDRSFDVVRLPPEPLPQKGILSAIKRYFLPRPVISPKACVKCGRCVLVCPVTPKALKQQSREYPPRYDYRRCIRCYCCHEVCPEKAISIKTTTLRKILPFAPYVSLLIANMKSKQRIRNAG